uniref:Uncharacterized protein n=1 Tax=Lactuca sativa TaxID=4236 RepID=A0A9R1XX20_LACSA|nr:hypothetical protein LSAT_V11C200092290 [Lactuca sativa]
MVPGLEYLTLIYQPSYFINLTRTTHLKLSFSLFLSATSPETTAIVTVIDGNRRCHRHHLRQKPPPLQLFSYFSLFPLRIFRQPPLVHPFHLLQLQTATTQN